MNRVLNLYGPINQLGFGQHFCGWAGHLIPILRDNGVTPAVMPQELVVPAGSLPAHMIGLLQAAADPTMYDPWSPSIWLGNLNDVHQYGGSIRVHYIVFEGSKLNARQLANAKKVDWILVPSRWAAQVLHDHGLDNVKVVPEGIDPHVFYPGDTGQRTVYGDLEDSSEMLTFVSVGKIEMRKGMQVALDAIVPAHRSVGRPMRILAHWFNPFIRTRTGEQGWFTVADRLLRSRLFTPATENVTVALATGEQTLRYTHTQLPQLHVDVILRSFGTHDELVRVYRAGEFGLFPHFAEGWGLPLHESMACGLPPITQNYSGPSEFLEAGSYLGVEGTPALAKDGNEKDGTPSFFRGDVGTWSQVRTESLAGAMVRAASMSPDERRKMGAAAGIAAHKFTWKNAAKRTWEVLKETGIL